jgi:hypothetical protein
MLEDYWYKIGSVGSSVLMVFDGIRCSKRIDLAGMESNLRGGTCSSAACIFSYVIFHKCL